MTAPNPLTTSLEGPAPAMEVAVDMAKRAVWLLPLTVVVGGFWGVNGIASAAYALAIRIYASSFGRQMRAIRDDDLAAESMGVNSLRVRVASFTGTRTRKKRATS